MTNKDGDRKTKLKSDRQKNILTVKYTDRKKETARKKRERIQYDNDKEIFYVFWM